MSPWAAGCAASAGSAASAARERMGTRPASQASERSRRMTPTACSPSQRATTIWLRRRWISSRQPSAEQRALIVADRTSRGVLPDEEEAARTELLVGPLGLQAVARLGAILRLLVVLVALLVGGDEAILQDGVEIGFDVVGGDDVVIVVVLARGDGTTSRTVLVLLLVLFLLDCVVGGLEGVAIELLVGEIFLVELLFARLTGLVVVFARLRFQLVHRLVVVVCHHTPFVANRSPRGGYYGHRPRTPHTPVWQPSPRVVSRLHPPFCVEPLEL